ncbi:hypothetical protein BRPE64_BCDS02500 [Caballeronia insecticola]|uniref:Uncharacterized protein n=1 Tax=Caballeronia insecticola TaxID=758793 RepID=R4WZI3_9BURK|nr:hypothetical protein BRPE64_BCDS02500 [Caballeronia insecticola]
MTHCNIFSTFLSTTLSAILKLQRNNRHCSVISFKYLFHNAI